MIKSQQVYFSDYTERYTNISVLRSKTPDSGCHAYIKQHLFRIYVTQSSHVTHEGLLALSVGGCSRPDHNGHVLRTGNERYVFGSDISSGQVGLPNPKSAQSALLDETYTAIEPGPLAQPQESTRTSRSAALFG
ncbi:hypothetical protein J6590_005585 [Homalodisca vitripennis]|nr:hypothetical protein J6590_005585 [Homalodisca vitripennis]